MKHEDLKINRETQNYAAARNPMQIKAIASRPKQ